MTRHKIDVPNSIIFLNHTLTFEGYMASRTNVKNMYLKNGIAHSIYDDHSRLNSQHSSYGTYITA